MQGTYRSFLALCVSAILHVYVCVCVCMRAPVILCAPVFCNALCENVC